MNERGLKAPRKAREGWAKWWPAGKGFRTLGHEHALNAMHFHILRGDIS